MIQYKYHRAVSLDDAVKVLKEYGGKARIVAGGTDILVQIHEKDKRWKDLRCLLDITYLDRRMYTSALCPPTRIWSSRKSLQSTSPSWDGPAPPWVPRRYETAEHWAEASATRFRPPTHCLP